MNDINQNPDTNKSKFKISKDKLSNFFNKNQPQQLKNNPNKINNIKPSAQENLISPSTNKIPTQSKQNDTNDLFKPTLEQLEQPMPGQPINQKQNQENTEIKETQKPKEPKINSSTISIVIKGTIILIVTVLLGFLIVNYQSISLRFSYWYQTAIQNQDWSELHPVEIKKAATTAQKLDENYLYIPTVGIQAPISWGIEDIDIKNMYSAGLVHYHDGALPDDATGNIFISGSTSGSIFSSSNYKTSFTLLDKVELNHVATIIYKNKIYSYKIIEIQTVGNSDITISPGQEDNSYLQLLAKYPVGLNFKTLVVTAELYKIESNIPESIEDKIEELPDVYDDNTLDPIIVTPENTITTTPTKNNIPDPETTGENFLPSL